MRSPLGDQIGLCTLLRSGVRTRLACVFTSISTSSVTALFSLKSEMAPHGDDVARVGRDRGCAVADDPAQIVQVDGARRRAEQHCGARGGRA